MSPVHSLEWNYIETGEPVSPQRSSVTLRGRGRGGEEPGCCSLTDSSAERHKGCACKGEKKKKRSLHPLFFHRRCPKTRSAEPPGGQLEVLTFPRAKVKCADGDAIKVYAGKETTSLKQPRSLVLLLEAGGERAAAIINGFSPSLVRGETVLEVGLGVCVGGWGLSTASPFHFELKIMITQRQKDEVAEWTPSAATSGWLSAVVKLFLYLFGRSMATMAGVFLCLSFSLECWYLSILSPDWPTDWFSRQWRSLSLVVFCGLLRPSCTCFTVAAACRGRQSQAMF